MSHDDSTVRLPGDRGRTTDGRYASDRYDGVEPGEQGFGGEYPPDDEVTARYQPGTVPYQPDYPVEGEDRTQLLGGGGWDEEPRAAPPVRDRLLVHGVWELLLLVLVGALAVWCYLNDSSMFSAAALPNLELQMATLGLLAIAMSISLRVAAPNLAVGGFAAVAGVVFARWYEHGVIPAIAVAVGVMLLGGLVLGLVVGILHVPGWAASLVALCGGFLAVALLIPDSGSLSLGNSVPAPGKHALPILVAVALLSVVGGVLGMIGPLRRGIGAFRPVADPAERRGVGAALMVIAGLVVSAGLAATAGILTAMNTHVVSPAVNLSFLLLPVGAVLLGGVSAFGRRGGVLGTMLGVTAVSLVLAVGVFRGWPIQRTTSAVAGGAILLGLVVNRLIEWGGRARQRTAFDE